MYICSILTNNTVHEIVIYLVFWELAEIDLVCRHSGHEIVVDEHFDETLRDIEGDGFIEQHVLHLCIIVERFVHIWDLHIESPIAG